MLGRFDIPIARKEPGAEFFITYYIVFMVFYYGT